MNNQKPFILASASTIRQTLLEKAGVPFEVEIAKIDEDLIKEALLAEDETPRNIADALAEGKARKVASKKPEAFVLGCDQVLSFKGRLISKANSIEEAKELLLEMSGERHKLLSAAVIYEDAEPVWRHIGEARLEMAVLTEEYIDSYLERNWHDVKYCVGSYMVEEEGMRLFSRIDGDYFSILGLPMLPLLNYLKQREIISA